MRINLTFFCNLITDVHFFSSRPLYLFSTSFGYKVTTQQLQSSNRRTTHLQHIKRIIIPSPIDWGRGIVFDWFLCFWETARCRDASFSSFVNITSKRLDRFAWNFQGRCGMTRGRRDSIFGQFGETAGCRDKQHGDGACCAFAQQLVLINSKHNNTHIHR